jgi:hypothetical protein
VHHPLRKKRVAGCLAAAQNKAQQCNRCSGLPHMFPVCCCCLPCAAFLLPNQPDSQLALLLWVTQRLLEQSAVAVVFSVSSASMLQ